ncbi:hypothetical protein DMUE_5922 [Dictyocoela muelleri]|nr:hypothetical protein DMUE_5922 [Dictyocoela muelleri]
MRKCIGTKLKVKGSINKKLHNLADNTNEPFEYALKAAYANLPDEKKEPLLNYESLRDYFKKRRNNKLKCDTEDENIANSYKFTFSNDLFLQFDSGKCSSDRLLFFATDKNVSYIEKSHVWLGDDSFFFSTQRILSALYFTRCCF